MATQLNEENNGKLLTVRVTGKLIKDDYASLCPRSRDSSNSTESCACCST